MQAIDAGMGGIKTPAADDDVAHARRLYKLLRLQVIPTVYPDYTAMPMAQANEDAVQALAQAFADERQHGAAVAASELAAHAALLRRAVGVVSDLSRLATETAAVLDAYAARSCAKTYLDAGNPRDLTCALPLGHRGPCGAVGQ